MSLESLVSAARENPLVLLLALLVPVLLLVTQSLSPKDKKPLVNLSIDKDNAKIVTKINCATIENDPGFKDGKLVLCRCWRSKKFPYCDGSHAKHNKETGDNVGPIIIEKATQ